MDAPDTCLDVDEVQRNQLVAYLQILGGDVDGYLALWDKETKGHAHFHTSDLTSAAVYALGQSLWHNDIYVRANVQGTDQGAKAETVSAMTVVTADIDVLGPAHAAKNLPASIGEAEELLQAAALPTPTVILATGGGLLAVWGLAEPFPILSDSDREQTRSLSRGFQGCLRREFKARSLHLDGTFDLSRPCRLPGTRNWKPAYGPDGRPVVVHQWSGNRLALADLERVAALGNGPRAGGSPQTKRQAPAQITPMPANEGPNTAQWSSIAAGCDALRAWAEVADGLPEPEWYALAGVMSRCEDGARLFHELSRDDSRYREAETAAKLAHAEDASGPRRCENIEALGGDCGKCPFRGRINSPMALARTDPAVVRLARSWVYVADRNTFFNLTVLEETQ